MRLFRLSVLYMALALSANIASADIQSAEALRVGDMKKLVFHAEPKPVSDATFMHENGGEGRLSDYHGKYILLNFWATWCAPCRKEMPTLVEIQQEFKSEHFEVVTMATRSPAPGMKRFFEKENITGLPLHRDRTNGGLASGMAVFGLPITVILDPGGREIARLPGDADWASDSAKAILRALIETSEEES